MRYSITKERTHLFSPSINVGVIIDIKGVIDNGELEKAIGTAVGNNGILRTKIVITDTGEAYYEPVGTAVFSVSVETMAWQDIITREEKIRFRLEEGELVRFFIIPEKDTTGVLIYGHHLAGDGISFAYLAQDIMRALAGEPLDYKPLNLFSMEDLPKGSELSGPLRLLSRFENRSWRKSGKIFSFADFDRLFQNYWKTHGTTIYTEHLEVQEYQALVAFSKKTGITINSIILTALIKAAKEPCDIGTAVTIRKQGYEGMGNFATGISIQYTYRSSKSFQENAKTVQRLMRKKLDDPRKKYFLLQFMGNLSPTLIDAAFFSAYDGYMNGAAKQFQKLFGYDGNPKGISVTNLTRLPIAQEYGTYRLEGFTFIPPRVTNAKRVLGIATLGERMVFTLHVEEDASTTTQTEFFADFLDILKNLSL